MTATYRPPRLAHVGAGRFSRAAHGPVLQRLATSTPPRLTLDGIADVDEARPARARAFCNDFGYRAAYGSVRELIAGVRPDILVCVVDTARQASVVADLLPTRIPLLLEKPPGASAADAAALADLWLTHRTLHYVAFNRRHVPAIESARRWLHVLGPPRVARASMLRQRRKDANFAVATGIHVVDTLRYLAGEIGEMRATIASSGAASREYRARVQFDTGCRGDLLLSMDGGTTRETYSFECDDETRVEATIGPPYSEPGVWAGLRVWRGRRVCVEEPAPDDPLVAIGIAGEYDAFLEALATGCQPDCSLPDAWRSMVAAEGLASGYHGSLLDLTAAGVA